MSDITSRRNPQVRLARALRRGKTRRETGLFLVEGLRHIGELLDSDFQTEFILYDPADLAGDFGPALLETARTAGVTLYATTPDILADLSEKGSSGGMIAAAHQRSLALEALDAPPAGWSVALVDPRDPGNIGTILRTMDAFQAGALFLLDGGADPWQPGAVRASMGALFSHPVVQGTFADFAAWAAAKDIPIHGTSAHAEADIRSLANAPTPAALLFGSERDGLSEAQRAACSQVYRIPIHGRGTSLNLAIAAGIALYATS